MPTSGATPRSSSESPTAMHSSGREPARAHVQLHRRGLRRRGGNQVVGVPALGGGAVVDQPQPVVALALQQLVGRGHVGHAAVEMGDEAVHVPRRVRLDVERALQQRGRAGRGDQLVGRRARRAARSRRTASSPPRRSPPPSPPRRCTRSGRSAARPPSPAPCAARTSAPPPRPARWQASSARAGSSVNSPSPSRNSEAPAPTSVPSMSV